MMDAKLSNDVSQLTRWLIATDEQADAGGEIDHWLYGRGLQQEGRYADAYESFMAALERTVVPDQYEITARRLAAWFDRMPALAADAPLESVIRLDTALLLAQHLHYPEKLTESLRRLYCAQLSDPPLIAPTLKHLGIPLVERLIDAAITNQVDRRYFDDWKRMAATDVKQRGFGPCRAAVRGVCAMPAAAGRSAKRDPDAVAEILAVAACALEGIDQRGGKFRQLVKHAEKALSSAGIENPEAELSQRILENHNIPQWAQVMLSVHVYFISNDNEDCLAISEVYKNAFSKIDGFKGANIKENGINNIMIIPLGRKIAGEFKIAVASAFGMNVIERLLGDAINLDMPVDKENGGQINGLIQHILHTIMENTCEIIRLDTQEKKYGELIELTNTLPKYNSLKKEKKLHSATNQCIAYALLVA